MKLSDIGSSFILMALGLFTIWQAKKLSLGVPRAPGPGFFPFYLGIILVVVALVLVIKGINQKPESPEKKQGKARVLMALASILIYALLMEHLGYLISTFFLMYFLLTMMQRKKWWFAPAVAGLITLVSYVMFSVCLEVLLPPGILSF